MRDLGPTELIRPVVGPLERVPRTPKICRAKPSVVLTYTLLSAEWITFQIHNIERRDTPCLGKDCPHAWMGHHRSAIRKHYIDAYSWLSKEPVVLEVSAGAMDPYISAAGEIIPFRRGQSVTIFREAGRPTGRVTMQILPAEIAAEQLPASFNVILALLGNWGADTHGK